MRRTLQPSVAAAGSTGVPLKASVDNRSRAVRRGIVMRRTIGNFSGRLK
jgi:hypothetical protein